MADEQIQADRPEAPALEGCITWPRGEGLWGRPQGRQKCELNVTLKRAHTQWVK